MDSSMNLPVDQRTEATPQEFSNGYFNNLDSLLQRSERTSFDRSRMDLNNAGLLRGRDEFTPAAEASLPTSEQRRANILLPELQKSSDMGRNERLSELAFQHERQFADEEFHRRLQEITAQSNARRAMLELKHELEGGGGFDWLGATGRVVGTAAGAYFGGAPGAMMGGNAGQQLFGRSGPIQS